MTWKAIGQSCIGTSHVSTGGLCEDAVRQQIFTDANGREVMVCCVSDGAGSAQYAAYASTFTVEQVVAFAESMLESIDSLSESHIYAMAEDVYYALEEKATHSEVPINEFSCTMLGCIITEKKAAFFQVGDGAIIRNDASGNYTTIWWPQNGEYHNTTSFLVDDKNFSNLQITIIEEAINEMAIFTDGLQQLALNSESMSVHQPFFTGMFHHLRMADSDDKINVLNKKLTEYLDSPQINERTDDDKTLFLATRLNS